MTPAGDNPHAHIASKRLAWTTRPGGHGPRAQCTRGSLVLGVLVLAAVVSAWLPLLKPIAALPGDLVCTSDEGLWIEGKAYGPVYPEAGGAPPSARI